MPDQEFFGAYVVVQEYDEKAIIAIRQDRGEALMIAKVYNTAARVASVSDVVVRAFRFDSVTAYNDIELLPLD